MKLAVLLYGQPRFWDLSYKSIIQETTFENSTTDYYFHFWDKTAYHSHDPEHQLTERDKKNIVTAYKPKRYSFTDYSILEEACEKVFRVVEKNRKDLSEEFHKNQKVTDSISLNDEIKNPESIEDIINNIKNKHQRHFPKTIFEVTKPENLTYYLGQFVSLEKGAKLIQEEYDYIFRIRTDVLFVTPDLYKNKKQYINDKRLFYNRLYKNEKGIFCRSGDLQVWEGTYSNTSSKIILDPGALSYEPQKVTNYNSFSFKNTKLYANNPREDASMLQGSNKSNIYNPKTQYLHMKDWYILGSGPEMLLSMKQYINTILIMIKKSKQFLIKNGIDNNWSAGELVCGEVLGVHGINAGELGFEYYNKMIIPKRYVKIANKHTKQIILDRPHVRVLADSDIPLKEQYKCIISKK